MSEERGEIVQLGRTAGGSLVVCDTGPTATYWPAGTIVEVAGHRAVAGSWAHRCLVSVEEWDLAMKADFRAGLALAAEFCRDKALYYLQKAQGDDGYRGAVSCL
jgi:hypothetical protein